MRNEGRGQWSVRGLTGGLKPQPLRHDTTRKIAAWDSHLPIINPSCLLNKPEIESQPTPASHFGLNLLVPVNLARSCSELHFGA